MSESRPCIVIVSYFVFSRRPLAYIRILGTYIIHTHSAWGMKHDHPFIPNTFICCNNTVADTQKQMGTDTLCNCFLFWLSTVCPYRMCGRWISSMKREGKCCGWVDVRYAYGIPHTQYISTGYWMKLQNLLILFDFCYFYPEIRLQWNEIVYWCTISSAMVMLDDLSENRFFFCFFALISIGIIHSILWYCFRQWKCIFRLANSRIAYKWSDECRGMPTYVNKGRRYVSHHERQWCLCDWQSKSIIETIQIEWIVDKNAKHLLFARQCHEYVKAIPVINWYRTRYCLLSPT